MKEIILVKYGEMALKGLNKNVFEDALMKNIRKKLKTMGHFEYSRAQSTIYVEPLDGQDLEEILESLSKIFGIATLCRAIVVEKDIDAIGAKIVECLFSELSAAACFRVSAKRADKRFPMNSPKICEYLGGVILDAFPHLTVSLNEPDVNVTVEIRDKGAYIHLNRIEGAGGLPIGTGGNAMLLMSGGIDSPVAGYMIAKRGIKLSAIHFVSPPYTSERARLKVVELCEKLSDYCGYIKLHCVPFTEIQEAIRDNCPDVYFTVIMRRLMFEIAQRIAPDDNALALVTGESLGQVASQTLTAMVCTDDACRMPVFRPAIGLDKNEIITIARKIDTFETSILPYEDCCTVFTPKHPRTRPSLEEIKNCQNSYNFEPMIVQAVQNTTIEYIPY